MDIWILLISQVKFVDLAFIVRSVSAEGLRFAFGIIS